MTLASLYANNLHVLIYCKMLPKLSKCVAITKGLKLQLQLEGYLYLCLASSSYSFQVDYDSYWCFVILRVLQSL